MGEKRDSYPLSFAQERLFYVEQLNPSNAYHIPLLLSLSGEVELSHLTEAISRLCEKHTILRTCYSTDLSGDLTQQVTVNKVNISQQVCATEALTDVVNVQVNSCFDLGQEVMRVNLYNTEDANYLLFVWHHIAFDGWSTSLFLKELAQSYEDCVVGRPCSLTNVDVDYIDYSVWQRRFLQGDDLQTYQAFWQHQLQGVETLSLPTDHSRPAIAQHQGCEFEASIDEVLSDTLIELGKEYDVSLNSVLLSAYYLTLAHLCDQQDIIVGTPSDNREHHQIQEIIGFFVNTLPLRTQVNWTQSVEEFVKQVHKGVMQSKAHQSLPFEQIVELMDVERDASRHPLFQVVFGLQDLQDVVEGGSVLPMTPISLSSQHDFCPAKFDLSLMAARSEQGINLTWNYATSLFEPRTIEMFNQLYQTLLEGLTNSTAKTVGTIPLMTLSQQKILLKETALPREDFTSSGTLIQAFEAQVLASPEAVALCFGAQQLSYRALNERANQLAHWLRVRYEAT
ncbi:non-ribosomal peptide synthetase, partial [Pseudoalteromonas aurantia]